MSRLEEIKQRANPIPGLRGIRRMDIDWLIDKLEKCEKALQAISDHQEIVGGEMAKFSSTKRIADTMLEEIREDK